MKNTMKKILRLILVLLMLGSVALVVNGVDSTLAATGQCGNNAYWNFDSETGKLIISGNGDMYNYGWDSPFNYKPIKDIIIENGITWVGQDAFRYCSELENVIIPDSVEGISFYAFVRCDRMANITVGENNNNYSSENGVLFSKSKKALIKYPPGKIDTYYEIPNGVTYIDSSAFEYANNLTGIKFSNSLRYIHGDAFKYCTNLINIAIPDNVKGIDTYAFAECTNLESVTIGNGVSEIDYATFFECTKLKDVTFSSSITTIHDNAFKGCISLSDIYYRGTEEQWNEIQINSGNEYFLNTNVHFLGENIPDDFETTDTPNEPEKELTFFEKIAKWFRELFDKLFGWLKR